MSKGKIIPSYNLYKTLDSQLGFEFSKLEESYNLYNAALPHRHNYYEILFFKEGGGTHAIDFTMFPILSNSLHFISPEQVHLLKREKHVSGYVLSFTNEFCDAGKSGITFIDNFPFFNNSESSPIARMITDEQQKIILEVLSKIKLEYFSSEEGKLKMLSAYMTIFLMTAKRIYETQEVSGKSVTAPNELTRKFKLLVEKRFLQEKSVSAYAELLNISPGHLNDTTQKEIGKSASEIIHERIILEAKRLLYHSEKSIKEIAFFLNYDDPSYFVKFFKTHTRMTPEVFRNQIRESYH